MRIRILIPTVIAIVLANLLVFGALGTTIFLPTPRPPRIVSHKTFTPNAAYTRRRVTATPTPRPPPLPTMRPTEYPLRDPRVPLGRPEE